MGRLKGQKKIGRTGPAWVKWLMAALCAVSFAGLLYIGVAKPERFYRYEAEAKDSQADGAAVETVGEKVENPAAAPEEEPADVRPFVMLDAGHGGEDQGVNRKRKMEKDINLAVTFAIRDCLGDDFRVQLTREDDSDISKYDRALLANRVKPDLFVSIHCNSSKVEEAYGIETYADFSDDESVKVAGMMQKAVVQAVDGHDRDIRDGKDLVVLYQTKMPSVLVEIGYMTNPAERDKLLNAGYQEKLAQGAARCIREYFDQKPKPADLSGDADRDDETQEAGQPAEQDQPTQAGQPAEQDQPTQAGQAKDMD